MKTTIRVSLLLANVVLLGTLCFAGCTAQQQPNNTPQQEQLKTPPPQPAPPAQPKQFSPEYIRGYNDGYGGAWLSPIHWFANEYRAGRSAGIADKEAGKPHRFHQ